MDPPRVLSVEEENQLKQQRVTLSENKIRLLELEAAKNWDKFYKTNTINFFKDRHWLQREFEPLQSLSEPCESGRYFIEIGCGVGNALFPIMEVASDNVCGFGCDFSKRAVDFVANSENFNSEKMHVFQCDIVNDSLYSKILECVSYEIKFDVATLIFVLSAIDPEKMKQAVENVYQIMNEEGKVCVRDYAVNDHAMLRFGARGHKISERFYVRQDNTRAFYFYLDEIKQLFEDCGFETESCAYKESKTVNHEKKLSVDRYFVQAVFMKKMR